MVRRMPMFALGAACIASVSVIATAVGVDALTGGSQQAGERPQASWAVSFSSIEDLSAASALVVTGRVGSGPAKVVEATEAAGGAGIPLYFTDWPFDVSRVLKGPAASKLVVRQTGTVVDGKRIEIRDDPLLESDTEYLLFLSFDAETGTYAVVGGPQGRLEVRNGRVSSLSDIYSSRNISDLGVRGMALGDVAARVQ